MNEFRFMITKKEVVAIKKICFLKTLKILKIYMK